MIYDDKIYYEGPTKKHISYLNLTNVILYKHKTKVITCYPPCVMPFVAAKKQY